VKRKRPWRAFCLGQVLGYVVVVLGAFQSDPARLVVMAAGILLLLSPLVIAGSATVARFFQEGFPSQQRLERVADEAARLGLRSHVHDNSSLMPLLPQLPVEVKDRRFRWVFGGTLHGRETRIFDFWYQRTPVASEPGTIDDLTCALLSLDVPVPVVVIKRADLGRRLLTGIGWKGALATGDGAFDERFELRAARPEDVSRVLTDRVRSTLIEDETCYLAQISNSLLYCGKRIDLSARRELLERATRLHHTLQ
jgi:hypothetical protein